MRTIRRVCVIASFPSSGSPPVTAMKHRPIVAQILTSIAVMYMSPTSAASPVMAAGVQQEPLCLAAAAHEH